MVDEKTYPKQSLLSGVSDLLFLMLFYFKHYSMPIIPNKIQSIEIYMRLGRMFGDGINI